VTAEEYAKFTGKRSSPAPAQPPPNAVPLVKAIDKALGTVGGKPAPPALTTAEMLKSEAQRRAQRSPAQTPLPPPPGDALRASTRLENEHATINQLLTEPVTPGSDAEHKAEKWGTSWRNLHPDNPYARNERLTREAMNAATVTLVTEAAVGRLAVTAGETGANAAVSRAVGSRGVRYQGPLTSDQQAQILRHIDEMGLDRSDFLIHSRVSAYSDMVDKVFLGPNVFPAPEEARLGGTVFERLTARSVIAHEAGHMIATRTGAALEAGSLMDEVQASMIGRELPGLSDLEKYQLLRDAEERARAAGTSLRALLR
jgi:hypothetical protein